MYDTTSLGVNYNIFKMFNLSFWLLHFLYSNTVWFYKFVEVLCFICVVSYLSHFSKAALRDMRNKAWLYYINVVIIICPF